MFYSLDDRVFEEIKRRAEYFSNEYYYLFEFMTTKRQRKLSKIVFAGNRYTCMLKYEALCPFIENRIDDTCDALYGKNYDPDGDYPVEEIVDYIVSELKHEGMVRVTLK